MVCRHQYQGLNRIRRQGSVVRVRVPGFLKFLRQTRSSSHGAIQLAENLPSLARSKHIDVRYRFLRDLVSGWLKVSYPRSQDPESITLTCSLKARSEIIL